MNTASLNLCKQLYELSAWSDTPFYHDTSEGYDEWRLGYSRDNKLPVDGGIYPAYDLGYLLRKLDDGTDIIYHETETDAASIHGIRVKANTPEDACAKLAIELFKQGVLKK